MFLPLDEQIMKGAHGMLVVKMPSWKASFGIQEEIKHFRAAGKPIFTLEWPALKIDKEISDGE